MALLTFPLARSIGAICGALVMLVVMTPAEAQRHGGGHRGSGGGHHAAPHGGGGYAAHRGGGGRHAGGGPRPNVNHARADARTRDVRHNSINHVSNHNNNFNRNVNVHSNRNVNVNVHGGGGCCGWDNHWHPVATAAAVTATAVVTSAVVGSIVNTVPATGCMPVNYGGMLYQQCGPTWYMPQAGQYVVVNPPY